MTNFKVRIHIRENDCYNEVWKVVGEKKYFARHVFGQPVWYFVADPLGYCELDRPCPDDYIFEICDPDGNVLFEDSNGDKNSHPFLTLEEKSKLAWLSIKNEYKVIDGLNDWLLSYMTQDNLAKDPTETQFCPDTNWIYCWYDRTDHSIIHEYEHLGTKYCIYAVTCKHRYCDCTWIDYLAAEKEMDWKRPYFIEHFGSCFNPVCGPMYSQRMACEYVMDALRQIYGDIKSLSYVSRSCWGDYYEHCLRLYDAAAYLIGKNLSREHVHAVAKAERERNTLYTSYAAITADYPECRRDTNLGMWR